MVSACVSTYGWHTLTGWCLYQAVDAADRVLLEARFRAPAATSSPALTFAVADKSAVSEGGLEPVVLACRLGSCSSRQCWSEGVSKPCS
jgi:hypothetical protein